MNSNKPATPENSAQTIEKRNSSSVTLNAFSRVTASVGLMLLFGFGGNWLDRWLGTTFLTITGFAAGGVLMLVGMLYAVNAAEYERRLLRSGKSLKEDPNVPT